MVKKRKKQWKQRAKGFPPKAELPKPSSFLNAEITIELDLYTHENDNILVVGGFVKTCIISVSIGAKPKHFPFYCQELVADYLALHSEEIFATGANFYVVKTISIKNPATSSSESPKELKPVIITNFDSNSS